MNDTSEQPLSPFRVPGPPDAYYITNFVSVEEEQYLLRKIGETPQQKWKRLANRRLQTWGGEVTKNVLFQSDMPSFMHTHPNLIERLRSLGAFDSSPHGLPNHVLLNEYLPGQGIMAHEDGPSYHPVVATISLGSYAVFHYYRYHRWDVRKGEGYNDDNDESRTNGRTVDPAPALTLLLEPRSAVITRSSLYTSYLHGIDECEEDVFQLDQDGNVRLAAPSAAPIANHSLLGEDTRELLYQTGSARIRRGTRYSLTCRDVARVATLNAHTTKRR